MVGAVRLTSKFQITIPKEAREAVGWEAGDKVKVVVEDKRLHIVRIPKDIMSAMDEVTRGMKFPGAREEIRRDRKSW